MEVNNDLISVSDAARRLGVSADSVRRLADCGSLPCLRLSNRERVFTLDVIERAARERRREAAGRER
jgi:excisionase family DNA binding protein